MIRVHKIIGLHSPGSSEYLDTVEIFIFGILVYTKVVNR